MLNAMLFSKSKQAPHDPVTKIHDKLLSSSQTTLWFGQEVDTGIMS